MLPLLINPASRRPPRILCLGAHSDDIEIGCGGTLLEMVAGPRKPDVRWIVFSGSVRRADEARRSAETILKPLQRRKILLESFRDGFFPFLGEPLKEYFETLKREFEPDLIFTHFRDDLHQDHRLINQLTWNTFRNHLILEYEIPKYDGDLGSPNFYVPLTRSARSRKLALLQRFFGTQRSKHWFAKELFSGLMRIRGMECCSGSGYAEGFYLRKGILAV